MLFILLSRILLAKFLFKYRASHISFPDSLCVTVSRSYDFPFRILGLSTELPTGWIGPVVYVQVESQFCVKQIVHLKWLTSTRLCFSRTTKLCIANLSCGTPVLVILRLLSILVDPTNVPKFTSSPEIFLIRNILRLLSFHHPVRVLISKCSVLLFHNRPPHRSKISVCLRLWQGCNNQRLFYQFFFMNWKNHQDDFQIKVTHFAE